MQDQGLGSWPARRARMTPHKAAYVQDGVDTTYAQLDERATRFAHALRERGIGRGDRVAFLGLNSVELVVTMFATAKLGAVFLPLNTRLAPAETAWILGDSEPALLVWDTGFDDVVGAPDVRELGLAELPITSDAGRGLDGVLAGDATPLDEPIGHDELFMIQYTSGTSGRPKGVQLSHGNIVWNVVNLLVDVDLRNDEIALVTAPLFHTAALNQVLFPTLLKGGTALIESRFDPDRALDLVEEHRVTLLFGVTSMYLALSQSPRWATADLTSLRSALSGGAPLPESLLRTWVDRGLMIIQGYGLTESSPGATMLRAEDGLRKLGSAGTSCFFSDVRVVTPALDPARPGEPGEVLVQGPNVTSGYWRNPQATEEAILDGGWLRTGDLAVADDEGYLSIVGRLKDMYISGGENVYPVEVEAAIYTHPAVAECAVIGVPDEKWGEVGRAVVVIRPGHSLSADELLAHLDGRLARYKHPRSVVVTDQLPHNASGKLVKARVRELHGSLPRQESES
ncbi:long-chain fatty acid--CoA ligase [Blastococcus sp. LR1]|uniref:acyl-CoA synthetase n=1 Tax=Blastococcus sp. LR1 TaxID=2877000 RepID=UPI001CCC436D|nr:long-chain fatty acid--CoA ligase [Blastococcus sp. LR1]MCA0145087.1 long-chain fatty acid--CoA ligase [Blastococcus sp. LR1]